MKRNLVLFGLVVGMGVQALDWVAMRGTAAPRQVGTKAGVALGEGAFPMPKGSVALGEGAFPMPKGSVALGEGSFPMPKSR